MCTVTYLPKSSGQFLFASNRDEAPKRAAQEVVRKQTASGKQLLYPRDTGANGTWIAVSDSGQLVCILNGALIKHSHRPPYRLSRGIMALNFFDYSGLPAFRNHYDFNGIEPFTMVVFDQGKLYDLRWDEKELTVRHLATDKPHLWSSCTLYPPGLQAKRDQWFTDFREQHPEMTLAELQDFHLYGGEGDPQNDVVMNRANIVRTTSITSLRKTATGFDLHLHHLLTGGQETHQLVL